jgi:hypothetical protein
MYDATLGRFLQRDPLGSDAGDPNLYAYADDQPTGQVDPYGMRSTVTQEGTSADDCKITVTTMIDFKGEAATEANVKKIVGEIEKYWNKGFRYGCCEVVFKIDWQILKDEQPGQLDFNAALARKARQANADVIELQNGSPKRDFVDLTTGAPFGANHGGVWYAQSSSAEGEARDNFLWTPAHEYGHLLGLGERYGKPGEPGKGPPHPGWENNVMGAPYKPVERRNVTEVLDYAVANGLAKLKNYCCPPRNYGKPGLALRYQGLMEVE